MVFQHEGAGLLRVLLVVRGLEFPHQQERVTDVLIGGATVLVDCPVHDSGDLVDEDHDALL